MGVSGIDTLLVEKECFHAKVKTKQGRRGEGIKVHYGKSGRVGQAKPRVESIVGSRAKNMKLLNN